jgi:hypothetical protein
MEVYDPPNHTSPAGLIELFSFYSATGLQNPNFRVASVRELMPMKLAERAGLISLAGTLLTHVICASVSS